MSIPQAIPSREIIQFCDEIGRSAKGPVFTSIDIFTVPLGELQGPVL